MKIKFKWIILNLLLQVGVLKPVTEATPWINSFVLVESKDKSRNLKLHICLNKAIIRQLYHFKVPDGIAHFIADSCIMTVCDCHKGYWYQELYELSSFLTTLNTDFGHYRFTVMPFGATVACDVFQCKLDQCFGQIPNVIVTADDIMVVGNCRIIEIMIKFWQPCLTLPGSAMWDWTMINCNINRKKCNFLENLIL